MRFSVRSLLGLVLLLGLALAALLNPSGLLYRVLVMVNLLLFATAVSCAIYVPSIRRPFWVGVVLFGAAYGCLLLKENPYSVPPVALLQDALNDRYMAFDGEQRVAFAKIAGIVWLPIFALLGGWVTATIAHRNTAAAAPDR